MDSTTFLVAVEPHVDGLFRLARVLLGSDQAAADATTNALVGAGRALERLEHGADLEGWLYRVLLNECRMTLREHEAAATKPAVAGRGGPRASGSHPREPGPSAAWDLEPDAALDALDAAFDRLEPTDRAVVALHLLADRPLAEVAAWLHMPAAGVRWRYHEARASLVRALEAIG